MASSSPSFVATSPYLVSRGEGSPSAVDVLQGEKEPPWTPWKGAESNYDDTCVWPEVIKWFCSTGVSSTTSATDLAPCLGMKLRRVISPDTSVSIILQGLSEIMNLQILRNWSSLT